MLARIELTRFRSLSAAMLFALFAALSLGGVLGYTFKPVVRVPGPTQVLVIASQADTSPHADACIWFGGHKHC